MVATGVLYRDASLAAGEYMCLKYPCLHSFKNATSFRRWREVGILLQSLVIREQIMPAGVPATKSTYHIGNKKDRRRPDEKGDVIQRSVEENAGGRNYQPHERTQETKAECFPLPKRLVTSALKQQSIYARNARCGPFNVWALQQQKNSAPDVRRGYG